ncbi:MAG: KEOPS complex N(6)-L-threonylcarbamoyladenine synthase Kae1 [Nanoarchaeota archaeon]
MVKSSKGYVLGVETTAHTFGVGVVCDGKVLSNFKDNYTTQSGGMIPNKVALHHRQVAQSVYDESIKISGIKESDIVAIAVSNAPGLAPSLLEGLKFTKVVAKRLGVPIIPVNHCVAHLEIGRLTGAADPVLLYASGANTQIISYSEGKYRVFGETLDVGVGNFIDTFARHAGIGFPGGPVIDKLAQESDKVYVDLPYSIKGMDVSFSGLLTNLKNKFDSKKYDIRTLAYSLQETVFSMLVEASERALAHIGKKELLLGGGVGCNKRLQDMCKIMCDERGAKFYVPQNQFLVDNGGMIAYLGEIMYKSMVKKKMSFVDVDKLDINPRERTDQVEVFWK